MGSEMKKVWGLGVTDAETRAKVASTGGKALLVKRGREYFSMIGKRGGKAISKNRAHMAAIGAIGGGSNRKMQADV